MSFSHALVNGQLMPFQDAAIPLNHSSFFTSYGVYESIQVLNGNPFHLSGHLTRLIESAGILQIEMPPLSTLLTWAKKLIDVLSTQSYALKILVLGPGRADESRIIAFLPSEIPVYPADYYRHGVSAISFSGERLLPKCKSLNTLVSHLGRMAAQKADALEAILVSGGNLYEGTRSNLFVVDAQSRQLLTPPAEKTLSGITKEIVIQISMETPTPVIECAISVDRPIDEMFITSTSMHIMPITHFDGKAVGDGKVRLITKAISRAFEDYHNKYYAKSPAPFG